MKVPHALPEKQPRRAIAYSLTYTWTTAANDLEPPPLETVPAPDAGTAAVCSNPVCPNRRRFLQAMALLQDLAHLVDTARSAPTHQSHRGA
jgi:hypothetical protein